MKKVSPNRTDPSAGAGAQGSRDDGQHEKSQLQNHDTAPNQGLAEGGATFAPGAVGPEPHIHPKQRELFAVTSGRMLATVGGVEHLLGPGDELQVQAGEAHTFRNVA